MDAAMAMREVAAVLEEDLEDFDQAEDMYTRSLAIHEVSACPQPAPPPRSNSRRFAHPPRRS